MTDRTFAADTGLERRDDALIALVDEGLSAYEISALLVGDVRLFDDSVTVRLVCDGRERFVRVTCEDNVRDLRSYVERDVSVRRSAPLFPGRSPLRAMTGRGLYYLLQKLREPEAREERA